MITTPVSYMLAYRVGMTWPHSNADEARLVRLDDCLSLDAPEWSVGSPAGSRLIELGANGLVPRHWRLGLMGWDFVQV